MDIRWTANASDEVRKALSYWENRNKSNYYSKRILDELTLAEAELSEDPYFLTRFFKSINLYRKSFFNRRFYLYFDILEEENAILIHFFRSSHQKPL